ncbi:MAG: MATE family efflux transporter [Bacteriovoracaceae bacterium]|jgi:multidrug resistance protein, MATE family|nr:MATE family efflux transporter [Bacteriovoracaceae bacterium]
MFERYLKQLKELFYFSLPLVAGQIGQMLYGTGDIMVAGRYSNEVVAALGVASAIFGPFIMVGLSLTYAVGSLTAQQIGTNDKKEGMLLTSHLVAVALGLFLYLIIEICLNYIHLFGFETSRALLIHQYCKIVGFSIIPILTFQVSKEYLQAYSKTYFANGLIFIFLAINVGLNYIFMFGKLGLPNMGIEGAAYATTLCRILSSVILFFYLTRLEKKKDSFLINKRLFKEIINLGIPIALGTFVEVLVFTTVTILIGRMSVIASAAHNIVLNLASLTFMLPLAMNSAAGVKVGIVFGQKDKDKVIITSLAALTITIICMSITATSYFLIPDLILRMFSEDQELIKYAAGLIVFVAMFQIPDGIQVTLWGILRGLNTTKSPMIITLLGNWAIGVPMGYYLAFSKGMEAKGLWAGLAIGLTCVSIGLITIFYLRIKSLDHEFKNLNFEDAPKS